MICSIGFLIHNVYIFKTIVKGDLSYSLYFMEQENYKLPNIYVCIDLNEETKIKVDENHKLNNQYLNRLTSSNLNLDNVFDEIINIII